MAKAIIVIDGRITRKYRAELTDEEFNNPDFELSIEELKDRVDNGSAVKIKDGDEIEIDYISIEDNDEELENEND